MFRIGVFASFGFFLGGTICQAQTVGYSFRVFSNKGFISDSLVAVNHGSKLFQVTTETGISECLLRREGKQTVISDPKGSFTQCTGLARNGGVVGYYTVASAPPYQAFAYVDGAYADVLPSLANPYFGNMINAVSPGGLMAWTYNPIPQQTYTIFLTYGTSYYSVPLPPDTEILQASGVNDKGAFVGQAFFITMWGDYTINYLFAGAARVSIGFPNASHTLAYNINNRGDVVGTYENADAVPHGFIYHSRDNSYTGPIDLPGATGTTLTGITEDGIVTGSATITGRKGSVAIIGYPPKFATAHEAFDGP